MPDNMLRLLERAARAASEAMRAVEEFVVARLGDPADAVLVIDESGQGKAGGHTLGAGGALGGRRSAGRASVKTRRDGSQAS